MKHPNLHRSLSSSGSDKNLNQIFFPYNCNYAKDYKYTSNIDISFEVVDEVYARNYLPIRKRSKSEGNDDEEEDNQ
jgi:hypothetical protein